MSIFCILENSHDVFMTITKLLFYMDVNRTFKELYSRQLYRPNVGSKYNSFIGCVSMINNVPGSVCMDMFPNAHSVSNCFSSYCVLNLFSSSG